MKRKTLTLLSFLCAVFCFGIASAQTNVTVHFTNGQTAQHTVEASGVLDLTEDGYITIKESSISGTPTQYNLDNVAKLLFSRPTSGIDNATEAKVALYPNPTDGKVTLRGLGAGSHEATLYATNGQQMGHYTLNENATIDLSDMPRGIYLLQVDGQRIKIARL